MRECKAVVALMFYDRAIGHTHIIVDAESHIEDGGNESSAMDWADEKFANGREIIAAEFGTESHVKERISIAHRHSVEVKV